ncbi:MAG: polyketide cyclase [Dehalococcoidia bacterium]|nr:polyketide cyclase [Dehalococcoidia bacterium]
MNEYHFVTHWRVDGTPEEVSDVLSDPLGLLRWWPAVYLNAQETAKGDERGAGRSVALVTKGWLPYILRWQFRGTESRRPHEFSFEAWDDLVGRGVWTFTPEGRWTTVTYDWRVRADKPLVRTFSLILKPLFVFNHRWAMARGEECLRLELQRRRSRSPEERAQVPAPPSPTFTRAKVP